jgi:universal stress protein A
VPLPIRHRPSDGDSVAKVGRGTCFLPRCGRLDEPCAPTRTPATGGVFHSIRTAGTGGSRSELERDLRYFTAGAELLRGHNCRRSIKRYLMSKLFKHILVPLDFTKKNAAALRVAGKLAVQNSSQVTLLHVIEPIDYADDNELIAFYESLKDRARNKLAKCGERFQRAKLKIREVVLIGKTARSIVDFSIQQKVDLVLMSSHKLPLEGGTPTGWATLSYQVSIVCQCPVMLVK